MTNPKLADLINLALDQFSLNLHTALPGQIETYDATKKKVSVKPLIKIKLGTKYETPPVISDVPVLFPGSSDCVIQFPLKRGDKCLLLFSESALDNWIGSIGNPTDPGDVRRHALTDAFCIPGLFPFSSPGKVGSNVGLEILYKNASLVAKDDSTLNLNGDSVS